MITASSDNDINNKVLLMSSEPIRHNVRHRITDMTIAIDTNVVFLFMCQSYDWSRFMIGAKALFSGVHVLKRKDTYFM